MRIVRGSTPIVMDKLDWIQSNPMKNLRQPLLHLSMREDELVASRTVYSIGRIDRLISIVSRVVESGVMRMELLGGGLNLSNQE